MHVEQTDEYRRWINELRDLSVRSRILVRVDRLIHGNAGVHRNLTDGVSEKDIAKAIALANGYEEYG